MPTKPVLQKYSGPWPMDMMGIQSSYRWDNEQDVNVKIQSE